MGPLKVARPPAPQAVFCLTDAEVTLHPPSSGQSQRRNHLLLTPYGRFLGGDDTVYVVASPLTVAAAAAAAGAGSRDPPVAHAVISEWTQMEFEVRAGLRESPVSADREDLPERLEGLAQRRRRRMAASLLRRARAPALAAALAATPAASVATAVTATLSSPHAVASVAATATHTPPASSSVSLQVVPVCCRDFLLFVQSFAVIMSTVMLIKNAVGAALFESLEL